MHIPSRWRHAKSRYSRSPATPQRPLAQVHRQRYSQPHLLPGDREMTNSSRFLLAISFYVPPGTATGQALDPAVWAKPLGDSWPTYSGDYSGKRYSSLKQINQSNVRNLTLAWVGKVTP